jgi:uncharacterized protein involved in type VI secretion and phage assembly
MPVQRSSNVFSIEVDGTPLSEDLTGALLEAFVEDEINLPDAFELVFRDPMRTVIQTGGFAIGKPVKIKVVSEASPEGLPILDGEITALEASVERSRTLTIVRGYDQGHRLQRGTVTETHLDMTYGDIAAKVAERRGISKGDTGSNTVVHEAVVQWNQTDWEFLSKLAAEIGHEVVVLDGKLHLREPTDSADAPEGGDLNSEEARQLVAGRNLLHLRAVVSGAEQVEEVQVRGWDFKAKEAIEGTAKAADSARSAAAGEGAADLATKLGGGTLVRPDLSVASEEVARNAAESLVEQLGSAAAELEGVVFGNPALRAGVSVSVSNVGAPFDGKYVLTSCRHTYEPENGYLTSFRVSGRQTRTMLGLVKGKHEGTAGRVSGVVPALVSNVDDPESLGRVKVSFPWLADKAESFWARVTLPGAGPDRGFTVLPEVGDEVLVGFDHGDTRTPYILGGLWNGKDKLPVTPVENGEIVTRAWVSRKGHKVELHDKDDAITIATGDGKHRVVLDQKNSKILIETSGDVEVTSDKTMSVKAPNGITMESSSGELVLKGNGVTIDAGAGSFSAKGVSSKVEGSGSAELSSSGQTTVRGSMVMVN